MLEPFKYESCKLKNLLVIQMLTIDITGKLIQ